MIYTELAFPLLGDVPIISLVLQKYCLITQFKPSHLVTNGLRGLAIILSENKRRIIIFDTNDEEEDDEEEENS
jgi:hypothetical protein